MMSAHPGAASAPIPPRQRWLADVGPGRATFLPRARPSSVPLPPPPRGRRRRAGPRRGHLAPALAVRVNIEAQAFADARFGVLARLLGMSDADHAIGKMARVWLECTARERVTLSAVELEVLFGVANVADALVDSGLGERVSDTEIRIRGCAGRTDWLARKREAGRIHGKKGGRPVKGSPFPKTRVTLSETQKTETPPAPAPAPAPAPIQTHIPEAPPWAVCADALKLADYLRAKILTAKPDHALSKGQQGNGHWPDSPRRRKWAEIADLMHRVDGREYKI